MLTSAEETYLFRHPLTREGAYQLLPPSARAVLHESAASAIESLAAEAEGSAVEVAEHLQHAVRWSGAGAGSPLAQREAAACAKAGAWLGERYRVADAIAMWRRVAAGGAALPVQTIPAWIAIAEVCLRAGRLAEGTAAAATALKLLAEHGGTLVEETQARLLAGLCALHSGNPSAAIPPLDDALQRARDVGDPELLARCLANRASANIQVGEVAAAEGLCTEAVRHAESLASPKAVGITLSGLAVVHKQLGRVDEAEAEYRRSIELSTAGGDARGVAISTANLAVLLRHTGRTQDADRGYRAALRACTETGDRRTAASVLMNLASLCVTTGRADEARQHIDDALILTREVGDRAGEGRALGNLGLVQVRERDFTAAAVSLTAALDIARATGERRFVALWMADLAELDHLRGRHAEAEEGYLAAIRMHRELNNLSAEGSDLGRLADVYRDLGRTDDCERCLREAIPPLRRTKAADSEREVLVQLAGLLRATRPTDLAAMAEAAELEARVRALTPNA